MRRIFFLLGMMVLIAFFILIGYILNLNPEPNPKLSGELATLRSLGVNSNIETIAICNESNFCQDYQIICYNGELIEKIPVPDATIQHPQDWKDTRNIDYNNLCGQS